ncbi:hypothetical protein KKE14_00020 [Patescibacteria group bacterium]|nr:hypothetical protein [Patescibacteria group bacterium]
MSANFYILVFMDSNTRKQDVLRLVVETFVHTNQPVGSLQVAEQLPYEVSSATVRNDMAEMTALDLLKQPHTSAGRVPTELGYRHYVKMLANAQGALPESQRDNVTRQFKGLSDFDSRYKLAVKMLADFSGSVGCLIDTDNRVYISGVGNIVQLPEFADENFRIKFSEVLDQPENFIKSLSGVTGSGINVLIGPDAKINNATVVISSFGPTGGRKVISIIGPMRMQYNKALPLIEHMKKILEEL